VVRQYGAHKGRNPKTGKTVDVPPKKLPFFKVGKELKEKVDTIKGKGD
jgi:integration host factor subunit beta